MEIFNDPLGTDVDRDEVQKFDLDLADFSVTLSIETGSPDLMMNRKGD